MKYFCKEKLVDEKNIVWWILGCFIISRLIMYVVCGFSFSNYSLDLFVDKINRADAVWYRQIVLGILNGDYLKYAHVDTSPYKMATWAFFPLYPLCVAIVYKLLGGLCSIYVVGMIVSSCCFFMAMYFGYKYIMLTRHEIEKAFLYIFLMSFGPHNVYFFIMYTESMFLMLVTMAMYFMKTKKYIYMGICGALLSATRNVGVFFVLILLIELIMENCKDGRFSIKRFLSENISNAKLVFSVSMMPLGLFSYMVFLIHELGDGLAFVHVQRAWRPNSGIINLLHNIKVASWEKYPQDYLEVAFFVSVILILAIIVNKRFEEAVLPAMTLFAGSISSFMSIPRFMMGEFTIMLSAIDQIIPIGKNKRRCIVAILCFISVPWIRNWVIGNNLLF